MYDVEPLNDALYPLPDMSVQVVPDEGAADRFTINPLVTIPPVGVGVGVAVAGRGVAVAGTGVAVAGIGVAVAGNGVAVAGTGVAVGVNPAILGPITILPISLNLRIITDIR